MKTHFTVVTLLCGLALTLSSARGDSSEASPLKGKWLYQFLSAVTDQLTFIDDTHMRQKSVMSGFVYFDIEADYVLQPSYDPSRMILTITKTDPKQVVKVDVGSQMHCIYRLSPTANVLDANCSREGDYPTDFAEGLSYVKIIEE